MSGVAVAAIIGRHHLDRRERVEAHGASGAGQRVGRERRPVRSVAVDDRERPHVRVVTSSSIEPVNFAYSSVSSEKDTSRSWPWNG